MSDNPKRAFLRIEMDLETYKVAITGSVPDANIALSLATLLYENIKASWQPANVGQAARIVPANFVPPYKARPE